MSAMAPSERAPGAGPALAWVDPEAGRAELGLGGLEAFAGLPHWRGRRLLTDTLLALLAREMTACPARSFWACW